MGQRYLLDTNIVIYYLEGLLNTSGQLRIKRIIENEAIISVISKIALLAWHPPAGSNTESLSKFIQSCKIHDLSESVVNETIAIRRASRKTKLPDAIIAATCLSNNFTLISRNSSDFKSIDGLNFINPFDL